MKRKVRVLVAKPGLDGHDRGAKFIARVLKDEGFEVVYTGLHQTPAQILMTALQEDVDVIGLSILSGGQIPLMRQIMQMLKENHMDDRLIIVGGIIPNNDKKILQGLGVSGFFGPGANSKEIVQFIKNAIEERQGFEG